MVSEHGKYFIFILLFAKFLEECEVFFSFEQLKMMKNIFELALSCLIISWSFSYDQVV